MYGNDSSGQSTDCGAGVLVALGLTGAGLYAGASYFAPQFFCPAISQKEREEKRKFSELAKEVNEQTTLQLEEIEQLKEALFKLEEDEAAYIKVAKIKNPELWALAESTPPPVEISARAVDSKNNEMILAQLLNTYPDLPPKGHRSYDEVKQYYEESSAHHSQVIELANTVLSEGYQGIQYSDKREHNPQLKSLLS